MWDLTKRNGETRFYVLAKVTQARAEHHGELRLKAAELGGNELLTLLNLRFDHRITFAISGVGAWGSGVIV